MQKLSGMSTDELAASKPTLQPLVDVKDKLKSGMLLMFMESLAPQVSFFTFVSPPPASLVNSRERSPALNRATR